MTEHTIGDGPIEEQYREQMIAVAHAVDDFLNGEQLPELPRNRKVGFVLLMFPFDSSDGRCNYISNAERADVKVLLREQLARFEGSPDVRGHG